MQARRSTDARTRPLRRVRLWAAAALAVAGCAPAQPIQTHILPLPPEEAQVVRPNPQGEILVK